MRGTASSVSVSITRIESNRHGDVVVHGTASPGARVTVNGRGVRVGADGRWSATVPTGTTATVSAVADSADRSSRSSTTVTVSA
ncbi:MAG TPA: hypothetical protein VFC33_09525 [Acidimicrobiia bacterium]|nr:hypothetical protein [Acidimicrobiia bacterium]